MQDNEQPPFHEELQCFTVGVEYDFSKKVGVLLMDEGSCCDMQGCLNMFLRIDPEVKHIQTIAGSELDTSYTKYGNDWKARLA
ncbi:hypothetical protein [Rhizobium sp. 768_B6_N1_8]|uniref:hypothetical protein n=1 Tax=unclassified Rhizobium TaxID=2613769 RepID=UPI003F225F28